MDSEFHLPNLHSLIERILDGPYSKLGEIASFSKTPVSNSELDFNAIPYISRSSIDVELGVITKYDVKDFDKRSLGFKYIAKRGDILISRLVREPSAIARVTGADVVIVSNDFAIIHNITDTRVTNDFLFYTLRSKPIQLQMQRFSQGTIIKRIKQSDLQNILSKWENLYW